MTIREVRRAMSALLNTKTGLLVYTEDVNEPKRPFLKIDLIDNSSTFFTTNIQEKTMTWDIMYFPSSSTDSCNNEIQEMLETINNAFSNWGKRVLQVRDRYITLGTAQLNITDNIGHYILDTNFRCQYGEIKVIPPMGKIEIGGLHGTDSKTKKN